MGRFDVILVIFFNAIMCVCCLGIIQWIGAIAVLSNGAVIAFTGQFIDRTVYTYNQGRFENVLHDEDASMTVV